MSEASKAVFLSYASQDAAAAQRLCESLRATGVEVWFDQNELVGGDAWDAKIRKQIKECALFVPIISQNTQARTEGYFRLEWRLADQRTHLMARGRPFLVPVVIDDTRDGDAHVPDSFTEVQWTKLPGGETPEKFCARVQTLLGGSAALQPALPTPERGLKHRATAAAAAPSRLRWLVAASVVFGVLVAGVAWWSLQRPVAMPANAARRDASSLTAAAPVSAAGRLVAKAWEQMDKTEMARNELLLAEGFCKQAAALEETNPSVWAAWSAMNTWYYFHGFERLPGRKEAARDYAQKALAIDPKSYDARYAWANFIVRTTIILGEEGPALAILRELLRERPDEPRALFALGQGLLGNKAGADEGFAVLERLAEKHPWFAGRALNELGWKALFHGRFSVAESAAERAVSAQPYWNNLGLRATLALRFRGDVDLAQAMVDRLPPSALQENWGISLAAMVADWRGDQKRAVSILAGVPRDWLENFFYLGPTSFLSGWMRQKANQVTAAEKDFRRALELIAPRLEQTPNDPALLYYQAEAQRLLGMHEDAGKTYRQLREVWPDTIAQATFEPPDLALKYVRQMVERGYGLDIFPPGWWFTAASLRHDPILENVRRAPGFEKLLKEVEGREKQQWAADAKTVAMVAGPKQAIDQSVAVLAFANLSDDPANEYFSDGISEELLNVLAKVPGLKVSARTSAFSFKGKNVPIPEIAGQLGVAYVVEGSVRKAGSQVRIAARLIKAGDGAPVWAEDFREELKDVFALQDKIAASIAANLQLKLGVTTVRGPVHPEAFRLYLAAGAEAEKASATSRRAAVELLQQCVALEPGHAAAWARLARVHILMARWGGAAMEVSFDRARAAAEKAFALEPSSPEVLTAVGSVRRTADWDWRGAEHAFARALELRPNDAETLADYAALQLNLGRRDEALRRGLRAVELDPLNAGPQFTLSQLFHHMGRFSDSERANLRALELAPAGQRYRQLLARTLGRQGRFDEAESVVAQEPDEISRHYVLGLFAADRGRQDDVRRAIEAIRTRTASEPNANDGHSLMAFLYARLGDHDRAFAALEASLTQRETMLPWIKTHLDGQPLHADPRWPAFLRKIGLHDEQLK